MMSPLWVYVVDRLLAAESRAICSDDPAAATERHHRLRGKYLGDAEFRKAVDASAEIVVAQLQQEGEPLQ